MFWALGLVEEDAVLVLGILGGMSEDDGFVFHIPEQMGQMGDEDVFGF